MVAPFVKALGALVVGAPVAAVLGLTARSLKKQEDAAVPVVSSGDSPLRVEVFSTYRDKRTHEVLSPSSFKKGYVSYDFRLQNTSARAVRGVVIELEDAQGDVVGHVRVGEVAPHAFHVFAAKKPWTRALEEHRVALSAAPAAVLTWRSAVGRRRAVAPVSPVRALGESPREVKRRSREKAPVRASIMA
ncbi:hypothetical protein [Frondihabitans cladoniiphilus]|uniref:DUF3426 domain-containing protein n=1 Tax=Frondihabitans cladoniiphilus TaxID=715785 RepID=A0ABP8W7Q0_9MICO